MCGKGKIDFGAVFPFALLVVLLAAPVVLREREVTDNPNAVQLVIISPHNEAIRYEFERAFRKWYREHCGRDVDIDWRTPGGTSEIVRYIDSEYMAAFRQWWTSRGKRWTPEVRAAVLNRKLKKDAATPEQWEARTAFLNSDIGIGIDLFFGGGQYEFGRMAQAGILVPCGFRERHPELFEGPEPILLQRVGGETWYDPDDRYYGACLAAFGICYNLDRWRDLGLDRIRPAPGQWEDLALPQLSGHVGLADPSKSGSITKAFEMLIQQQMAQTVQKFGYDPRRPMDLQDARALEAAAAGWDHALYLVRRIGANARYFTFSASRVPVDVSQGIVSAGMCIDFYGRGQAEWAAQHIGREVMRYVTPAGGSSVSADPIGMLRGAPHRETAELFIDFVLSKEGQRLWNYRPGTPGGPEKYALRRLPIRRDVYTPEDRSRMSDPAADPFRLGTAFLYHPEWTGRLFRLIRLLIRVMIIDCHEELRDAWRAICEAGGADAVPDAVAEFRRLPFPYSEANKVAAALNDSRRRQQVMREWADFFRDRYRTATRLAWTAQSRNPATTAAETR